MTGWIIAGAVLLAIVLILCAPVCATVEYDGEFRVFVSYIFLRFKVVPAKPKDGKKKKKSEEKAEEQKKAATEEKKSLGEKLDKLKSTDVNKAIQRSLTKAIARHGLGLYIYAGEDLPQTLCEDCGGEVTGFVDANGKLYPVSKVVESTRKRYGRTLCTLCSAKAKAAMMAKEDKKIE